METKPAVLIVDDNPQVRGMAAELFASLGTVVFDAYHGEQALRLLLAHPEIELLFADVRMPGMNGVELVAAARRLRPGLKAVLTSGYVDHVPLPDVPFIRKPWRVSQLAALLPSQ
jgi:CheY-like chemotaxis protein